MNFTKPGRPSKGHQLRCHFCKSLISPKNGDWYMPSIAGGNQQVFACRICEPKIRKEYKQASLCR